MNACFKGLVMLIMCMCSWGAYAKNYQVASIAFYNVENLFDTLDDPYKNDNDFLPKGTYNYTAKVYQKKLQNIAKVISGLATDKESKFQIPGGPAIIGLAEIENANVVYDLTQQQVLKERNYRILHFESPDYRGVDVGLIYRPDLFTVLGAQSLYVDITDDKSKSKTRDVLYASGILAGDTIHILVGHWPSRSGGEAASMWKRERAARVCRNVIDSLQKINPEVKVVVMGDLNDDPVSPSVVKTLGATGDLSQVKATSMYNPWMAFYKKGIGTLGYNDSWNLFDQIIVSGGLVTNSNKGWKYHKAEIYNRQFLVSQFGKYKGYPHRSFSGAKWMDGYSDHFPTMIYLLKETD